MIWTEAGRGSDFVSRILLGLILSTATNWSEISGLDRILTKWSKWSEFVPNCGLRSEFIILI